MTRALPVVAALVLASFGGAVHAETPWIFVVGNNVGLAEDAPLRYAERDAVEVATVFQILTLPGGVALVVAFDAALARCSAPSPPSSRSSARLGPSLSFS